jgi:hypothetical protein
LYACTPASSFLLLYGAAAYFFSHKMVRLILLTAPIASVCGGIALGYAWAWIAGALFGDERPSLSSLFVEDEEEDGQKTSTVTLQATPEVESTKGGKKGKKKEATAKAQKADDNDVPPPPPKRGEPLWSRGIRLAIGAYAIQQVIPIGQEFYNRCDELAHMLSHPTIISKFIFELGPINHPKTRISLQQFLTVALLVLLSLYDSAWFPPKWGRGCC